MPFGDLNSLVNHLLENGVLKTPVIIDAFKNIDRSRFTGEDMKCFAYADQALPIPGNQTISQPYTVAFMLELLEPKPGEKILDIGAGSGWQTALLAHIVSSDSAHGKVFAMEIVPELCKFGKANVAKAGFIEKGIVEWICGDASSGFPREAPFDKIIAAAALGATVGNPISHSLPQAWKDQLKVGGKIVVPIGGSIWLFTKKDGDNFEEKEYPGFAFVPFVENYPQSQ